MKNITFSLNFGTWTTFSQELDFFSRIFLHHLFAPIILKHHAKNWKNQAEDFFR